jgi:hypothetical protein
MLTAVHARCGIADILVRIHMNCSLRSNALRSCSGVDFILTRQIRQSPRGPQLMPENEDAGRAIAPRALPETRPAATATRGQAAVIPSMYR